jgi:hypothetical protein
LRRNQRRPTSPNIRDAFLCFLFGRRGGLRWKL